VQAKSSPLAADSRKVGGFCFPEGEQKAFKQSAKLIALYLNNRRGDR
jgi:hypothetical protein